MITYKHEPYIIQAIDGILNQVCNFKIELILANDCSPDNTDEIVKSYLKNQPKKNLVKYIRHSNNKGMMGNFIWALGQCQGKYTAICEGDDYWTDPLKLQKQVDFLEENEDYGLVHTNSITFNQRKKEFIERVNGKEFGKELPSRDLFFAIIKGEYIVATKTAMFRKTLLNFIEISDKFKMGDTQLWLQMSLLTKFKFLSDVTAVYRASLNSASRPKKLIDSLLFPISGLEMRIYYIEKHNFHQVNHFIQKYRELIFNFRKKTGKSIYPLFKKHFSDEELLFLRKEDNFLVRGYKKMILFAINWKHFLIRFT